MWLSSFEIFAAGRYVSISYSLALHVVVKIAKIAIKNWILQVKFSAYS